MNSDGIIEDDDYSIERELKREAHRRGDTKRRRGDDWGATKQGQAIRLKYCEPLAELIAKDRHIRRRDKTVWTALTGISSEDIADRLLTAGVTACWGAHVGVDADRAKNYRDQRIWLGEQLAVRKVQRKCVRSARGEIALKLGDWGSNLLASLPVFKFDDDRLLTLPLTDEFRTLVAGAIVRSVATQPYLTPLLNPPEPWTGFREGVLAKGRWATPPLIRGHHPSIENAARHRIRTGQMQPVLDAVNSLQSVPFAINEPVLKFVSTRQERLLPKLLPPPDADASNYERWRHLQKEAEIKSELVSWELTMAAADFLVQHERFYVPLNIDLRGRLYPVPFFNFTREDRVRALFLFADGLPIGEEGLRWLKAHVAARANGNTWSSTKRPSRLNLNERIAWTENNLDTLYSIGEAVLSGADPARLEWALPEEALSVYRRVRRA